MRRKMGEGAKNGVLEFQRQLYNKLGHSDFSFALSYHFKFGSSYILRSYLLGRGQLPVPHVKMTRMFGM